MAKASVAKSKKKKSSKNWLRQGGVARSERRYAPTSSGMLGVLATSAGALCVGAGVFARFVSSPPHPYAIYLLGAGALLAIIGFFVGLKPVPAVRVGDAGVGIERDGDAVERLDWHEIEAVRLAENTLSFGGGGRLLSIPVAQHAHAAGAALKAARSRIPARVSGIVESLPTPPPDEGTVVVLEPMQLAGQRCKASSRIISVEKDGRFCGRCGQTYHKDEVPDHCLSCDARLVDET